MKEDVKIIIVTYQFFNYKVDIWLILGYSVPIFRSDMKNIDLKIRTIRTNGKGLWSDKATTVNIIGYKITNISEQYNLADIKLYFDNSWDFSKYGLIYTDPIFLREARNLLKPILKFKSIDYTEQGMQGSDFVSLQCSFSKKQIKELLLLKEII